MAVNVTVRDIVNYPGGTAKTITVDIIQVVPVAGNPEGDEIWVSSATTSATASGSAAIENIYKSELKRGFIKSSGLVLAQLDIPADYGLRIAIDEANDITDGINIVLANGDALLQADIAQDIEDKIQAQARVGEGGAKAGNLSYLNSQVRVVSGKYIIESGSLSDTYTGTGKSAVVVGASTAGGITDASALLGFDITMSSETLAGRQIAETSLAANYTSGTMLEVVSTAGLVAGDAIKITDGTISQVVSVSGAGVADSLAASEIQFVTATGSPGNLANPYSTGAMVRLLHETDVADPVSAVTTMDELYRFKIDSIVNQIDFSA